MRTLAEIQSYIQSEFNDTSTGVQTALQLLVRAAVADLSAYCGWKADLKSKTRTTVASQSEYNLYRDHRRMRSIKVTVGGVVYFPKPISSSRQWESLTENSTGFTSDIPEFYRVNNGTFELYPTPSSSGNTITIEYFGAAKRYSSADFTDYSTGTISLTASATAVTGSGTTFAASMVDRYLVPTDGDGQYYKIGSYTNATSIALSQAYEGSTASGLSYLIGTLPSLVVQYPEAAMVIVNYVLGHLWRKREDVTATAGKATHFLNQYEIGKRELYKQIKNEYDSPDVYYVESMDQIENPNFYPTNLS